MRGPFSPYAPESAYSVDVVVQVLEPVQLRRHRAEDLVVGVARVTALSPKLVFRLWIAARLFDFGSAASSVYGSITWHEAQNCRFSVYSKPATFPVRATPIGMTPRPNRSRTFVAHRGAAGVTRYQMMMTAEIAAAMTAVNLSSCSSE